VQQSTTAKARLRLLGSPGLVDATGAPVALPARAAILALYVLTAVRDLTVPRAQLASFLWPDAAKANANLRQLLTRLGAAQRAAGVDFVRFDRGSVTLNLEGASIDLLDLQAALARLDWTNWQDCIDGYRGELLDGITVAESDLTGWLDLHRRATRDTLVNAFAALLESPAARGNPRTVQEIASRILEIDATCEPAYRAMMRAFAGAGAIELVMATYERCVAAIEREFGVGTAPQPTTVATFRRLQAEAGPVRITSPAAAARSPVPVIGDVELRARLPRLVILPPPADGRTATLVDVASLILDDTIVGLCNLRTIRVVAPHTSWELSGKFDEATALRYNIGYALETAFRRRGDVDLLAVRLFDTNTRDIAWADTYELSAERLASSHRALSSAITSSLADAIEYAEVTRHQREAHPQAYYWYLMGQKDMRFMDLPAVTRARKHFRTAVSADPSFAPAYSGSARATQRQWLVMGRGDTELLDEAEQIGARAISLDHRDARGYREIALCNLYRRRWDDAVSYFTEAERLGPQYADLISDFGDALGHAGEPAKGLEKVQRAMELNPIPPDQYWWNAAGLHFQLRNYEAALEAIGRMGDPLPALRIAAAAWAYLGNQAEAQKCAAQFLQSYPDFRIAHWLSIVPDRNPDDQRHYEVGLKMAGFV
jgi:DNA-binding SARP family transcriptional activator/TolB-like protein